MSFAQRPGAALANELRSLRDVFGSPDLRRLELAWLATSVATWGGALALAVYAHDAGGVTAVGVMGLLRTLPGATVAPFLALLADRHPRRSVLLTTNALRALTLAGIALAVGSGAELALVYTLAVLLAILGPGYKPAQAAMLPLLARTPAELSSANVAASMLVNCGFLIGAAAGGVLLTLTSAELVLGAMAAIFAGSLLPLARISRDERREARSGDHALTQALEGFRFVGAHAEDRVLVGVVAATSFVEGAIDTLIVIAALGFLDIGDSGAGYGWSAWGVGAIAGGGLALGLLSRNRLSRGITLGSVTLGGGIAVVGLTSTPALAGIAILSAAAGSVLVELAANTLLQRLTPDHVIARVFGVVETLYVIGVGLGALAAGTLAGALGTRAAFFVIGALMPGFVLLARARLSALEAGAPVPGREYGLLHRNRIFAPLAVATTERLARTMLELRPGDGETVIVQGEAGDRYYVIAEGELDAFRDHVHLETMRPGDGFGEIALLRAIPRTATVTAKLGVVLLALERESFLEAVTGLPYSERAAEAIAAERMHGRDPGERAAPAERPSRSDDGEV